MKRLVRSLYSRVLKEGWSVSNHPAHIPMHPPVWFLDQPHHLGYYIHKDLQQYYERLRPVNYSRAYPKNGSYE